mgnify:CR=1 FL=1
MGPYLRLTRSRLTNRSSTSRNRVGVYLEGAVLTGFILDGANLMAAFTTIESPILDLAGQLRAESASLTALRDLLLPKLVTGQINVLLDESVA